MISVQREDFDQQREYQNLQKTGITGAIVTFVGLVRDFAGSNKSFALQHYAGMTESVLNKIEYEANQRWPLNATRIIHRYGELEQGEQIVFVGVAAAHRRDAFAACEFMIDILKTKAPFWKKQGGQWLDANPEDQSAAMQWLEK